MKGLLDYIYENMVMEGYRERVSPTDLTSLPQLNLVKCDPESIQNILDWLAGLGVDRVMVDPNKPLFKIPREFTDMDRMSTLTASAKEIGWIPRGDRDYFLKGRTPGGQYINVAIPGNGSERKIPTSQQEEGTCLIWNMLASTTGDSGLEGRESEMKSLISSISQDLAGNRKWMSSYIIQISSIKKFLLSKGIKDFSQYRCVRWGSTGINKEDESVSKACEKFLRSYLEELVISYEGAGSRVMKDNYNPTDIFLYKVGSGVPERLASLCTGSLQERFFGYSTLYTDGLFMGLSLKQARGGGRYHEFNVRDGGEEADEFRIDSARLVRKAHRIDMLVKGQFFFLNTSDPEDPTEPLQIDTSDELHVVLRDFSGDSTNITCEIMTDGPSLGKVPKRWWRRLIGAPESGVLQEYLDAWEEFFHPDAGGEITDRRKLNDLSKIISYGVKAGPWCLPFVLIH